VGDDPGAAPSPVALESADRCRDATTPARRPDARRDDDRDQLPDWLAGVESSFDVIEGEAVADESDALGHVEDVLSTRLLVGSDVRAYARALAELGPWMPIWPPGSPVEVGSVGTVADETFIPMGTAADAALELPPLELVRVGDIWVAQRRAVTKVDAGRLSVRFPDPRRLLLVMRDVMHRRLADPRAAGEEMLRAWVDGRMGRGHDTLVTETLCAGATLIALPRAPEAEVVFRASPDGPQDLVQFAGATLMSSRDMGLVFASEAPTVVALQCLRVDRRGLFGRHVAVQREPGGTHVG
jgi:hypothetical protein